MRQTKGPNIVESVFRFLLNQHGLYGLALFPLPSLRQIQKEIIPSCIKWVIVLRRPLSLVGSPLSVPGGALRVCRNSQNLCISKHHKRRRPRRAPVRNTFQKFCVTWKTRSAIAISAASNFNAIKFNFTPSFNKKCSRSKAKRFIVTKWRLVLNLTLNLHQLQYDWSVSSKNGLINHPLRIEDWNI